MHMETWARAIGYLGAIGIALGILKLVLSGRWRNSIEISKKLPGSRGGLLRRFQRQFHHFGVSAPNDEDIMEWLTVMQHYGAPTRLLDWTHSFFAGLFFAVEEACGECAVWALDVDWLSGRIQQKFPHVWKHVGDDKTRPCPERDINARKFETYKSVFMQKERFVIMMNSFRLNDRLVIQQGTFLCPGDITISFEDNLMGLLGDSGPGTDFDGKLAKIIVQDDSDLRTDIVQKLHRMNMNRATLFPGLDGFAKSLTTLLAIPEILVPGESWPE